MMSVWQGQREQNKTCCGPMDQGMKLTSHPPFAEGCQDREWHRGASPGSACRDTEQGHHRQMLQSGNRKVSTLHHSSQEPCLQPAAVLGPDAVMGSRLLSCVTLCLLGAGESWTQCGSF